MKSEIQVTHRANIVRGERNGLCYSKGSRSLALISMSALFSERCEVKLQERRREAFKHWQQVAISANGCGRGIVLLLCAMRLAMDREIVWMLKLIASSTLHKPIRHFETSTNKVFCLHHRTERWFKSWMKSKSLKTMVFNATLFRPRVLDWNTVLWLL